MSPLGIVHTIFAAAALLCGLLVLVTDKGTASHRRLGWAYVAAMVGMLATSFGLYRLFGRFGIFHAFSIWAAVTLLMGVLPAVGKRGRAWVDRHYYWMTYSYVGLLAAAASEAATRLPGVPFGPAVAVATGTVLLLGAMVVHTRGQRTLRRVRKMWIRDS